MSTSVSNNFNSTVATSTGPTKTSASERRRGDSVDFNTTKRNRTGSISGRLRTASDLEELGFINQQQKGLIKDLIISGDPSLSNCLDKYEKGQTQDLLEFIKTSVSMKNSTDLLAGLDFDFMSSLNTVHGPAGQQPNGSVEDFDYLWGSNFGGDGRDDGHQRRGSLDSLLNEFPFDDDEHLEMGSQSASNSGPPNGNNNPMGMNMNGSDMLNSQGNSQMGSGPMNMGGLPQYGHMGPPNRMMGHPPMTNDMYGMYPPHGVGSNGKVGSGPPMNGKKQMRDMNDNRVDLSAYAMYAQHLQNSNNDKKGVMGGPGMNMGNSGGMVGPPGMGPIGSGPSGMGGKPNGMMGPSVKKEPGMMKIKSEMGPGMYGPPPSMGPGLDMSGGMGMGSSLSKDMMMSSMPGPGGMGPGSMGPGGMGPGGMGPGGMGPGGMGPGGLITQPLTNAETFKTVRLPGYIGAYSAEQRKLRIEKFLEKRSQRVWARKVKYDVRKNFADSRLRIKGRFVKKEDEDVMRELLSL